MWTFSWTDIHIPFLSCTHLAQERRSKQHRYWLINQPSAGTCICWSATMTLFLEKCCWSFSFHMLLYPTQNAQTNLKHVIATLAAAITLAIFHQYPFSDLCFWNFNAKIKLQGTNTGVVWYRTYRCMFHKLWKQLSVCCNNHIAFWNQRK